MTVNEAMELLKVCSRCVGENSGAHVHIEMTVAGYPECGIDSKFEVRISRAPFRVLQDLADDGYRIGAVGNGVEVRSRRRKRKEAR